MIDSLFESNLPSCPHLLTRGKISLFPPSYHNGGKVWSRRRTCFYSFIYSFCSLFFLSYIIPISLACIDFLKSGITSRDGMLWKLTERKKWRDVNQLTLCVSGDLYVCLQRTANGLRTKILLKSLLLFFSLLP